MAGVPMEPVLLWGVKPMKGHEAFSPELEIQLRGGRTFSRNASEPGRGEP